MKCLGCARSVDVDVIRSTSEVLDTVHVRVHAGLFGWCIRGRVVVASRNCVGVVCTYMC